MCINNLTMLSNKIGYAKVVVDAIQAINFINNHTSILSFMVAPESL